MQTIRTAAAALIGLAFLAAAGSSAQAQTYPWCLITDSVGALAENCGFQSYEQCRASAMGQGGFCERNARYEPPEQRQPRDRHRER